MPPTRPLCQILATCQSIGILFDVRAALLISLQDQVQPIRPIIISRPVRQALTVRVARIGKGDPLCTHLRTQPPVRWPGPDVGGVGKHKGHLGEVDHAFVGGGQRARFICVGRVRGVDEAAGVETVNVGWVPLGVVARIIEPGTVVEDIAHDSGNTYCVQCKDIWSATVLETIIPLPTYGHAGDEHDQRPFFDILNEKKSKGT